MGAASRHDHTPQGTEADAATASKHIYQCEDGWWGDFSEHDNSNL